MEKTLKPIRLVHCATTTQIGGGIERMDALYHRFLNRSLVDPQFVVTQTRQAGVAMYDDTISYHYTGVDDRFEQLVKLFSTADIVQFSGGYEPMICEAAKASGAPLLIELMHLTEPGQLYPYIDMTICVSETVRHAQPDMDRTVVIHNGIDLELFPFNENPRVEGKVVLLESARREKRMYFHLDELEDGIVATNPQAELWLAGREQTGKSTRHVKFLGLRTDMSDIYMQADFLVMLSRLEPFGLIALEAMASGALPIVADDGGMAEIVTDGVDGWMVPAHDTDAVLGAIDTAIKLRGTDQWREMRKAARKKVETRFNARRCVAEYERVYADLIKSKPARTRRVSDVDPSPEALLSDAILFFNSGMWENLSETVRKISGSPKKITIDRCAHSMELLARQFLAREKFHLADLLFTKLFRSGYGKADWIKDWLEIIPDGSLAFDVANELLTLAPGDPDCVLLAAELYINGGRPEDALEILRAGVRAIPDSEPVRQVFAALCEKINPAAKGQRSDGDIQ